MVVHGWTLSNALPFKEDRLTLSNNRNLARQRLSQSKQRLNKSQTFKEHNTTFMSELLAKGYTEPTEPPLDTQPVNLLYSPLWCLQSQQTWKGTSRV